MNALTKYFKGTTVFYSSLWKGIICNTLPIRKTNVILYCKPALLFISLNVWKKLSNIKMAHALWVKAKKKMLLYVVCTKILICVIFYLFFPLYNFNLNIFNGVKFTIRNTVYIFVWAYSHLWTYTRICV